MVTENKNWVKILNSYDKIGKKILPDGTILIGMAPHIASEAWLHSFYPPLTDQSIAVIENQLSVKLPDCYTTFLKQTNGLNIFNTTLSFYGLRKNYKRSLEDSWQPFDILTPNLIERPVGLSTDFLVIGSYDWDGSIVVLNLKSERVFLSKCDVFTPFYEWNNFSEMIEMEIERLSNIFDNNGKQIRPNDSTLPIII